MKYVLDASVAIKWALPEADSLKALALRDDYRNAIHELIAPDIFQIEVAHALTRAERSVHSDRLADRQSGRARAPGPPFASHFALRAPRSPLPVPRYFGPSLPGTIADRSRLRIEGHQYFSMCSTTNSVPRAWLT